MLSCINRENTQNVSMSSNKSSSFLSDFGINSAEVMSKAIVTASEANGKHNHNVPEFLISNSIVLSASMFGAIYLFSTLLIEMNKKWIKQEKSEATTFEIRNVSPRRSCLFYFSLSI